MTKKRSKTIAGREVYYRPPTPEPTADDYYHMRARKVLTDHSRSQLEALVKDWVSQEAYSLTDESQRWRAKRFEHDGSRTIPADHVKKWPWAREIRTTSTIFVPTHYGLDGKMRIGQHKPSYVLYGLCMRVTEDRELMWKPGQVETPYWFAPEANAARTSLTWKRRQVQPLKKRFERTLVEHLPDQILASLYRGYL